MQAVEREAAATGGEARSPTRELGRGIGHTLARVWSADDSRSGVVWPVYVAMLLSLAISGLLTTGRLVRSADTQPYGPRRDAALTVARAADDVARTLGLDRLASAADIALGRNTDLARAPAVAPAAAVPGQVATPRPVSQPAATVATTGSLAARPASTVVATVAAPSTAPATSTVAPAQAPTAPPTSAATSAPTSAATSAPTSAATSAPTVAPTTAPTGLPTSAATPALAAAPPAGAAAAVAASPDTVAVAAPAQVEAPAPEASPVALASPAAAAPDTSPVAESTPPAVAPDPVLAAAAAPPVAETRPDDANQQPSTSTRAVTPENPLRVYLMGDSFVSWLGYDLQRYGGETGLMTASIDAQISSGLALPQFYNWPMRLAQVMKEEPTPEAVVVFMGANDDKPVVAADGSLAQLPSDEWVDEYSQRAGTVMDLAHQGGARVYWIGMPVMRDPRRHEAADRLNAAVARAAQGRPWVRIVDTWVLFANEGGAYDAYRPDPSGEQIQVRQADGVHLTQIGTRWVSDKVYAAIVEDWKLVAP